MCQKNIFVNTGGELPCAALACTLRLPGCACHWLWFFHRKHATPGEVVFKEGCHLLEVSTYCLDSLHQYLIPVEFLPLFAADIVKLTLTLEDIV